MYIRDHYGHIYVYNIVYLYSIYIHGWILPRHQAGKKCRTSIAWGWSMVWVRPLKTWKAIFLIEEPPFNNWGTTFWSISFHIIPHFHIYIYHGGYTNGEWIGYVSSLWSCMTRGEPYFHIFLAFQDSCRKTEFFHDQLIVASGNLTWFSY